MITVSVPGKVHLMGEHAVVYGSPALLSAINLRLRVSIEENKTGLKIVTTEKEEYARHAIDFLAKTYKLTKLPSVTIQISSDIPAGFHLGSSAAVAVGITGAFTYFVKKTWNPIAINQLAYEIEKKQHGNPSGGDNTIVTMGGFVWFRKELETLKSIWQLPIRLPEDLNHFFLINTGRPVETTGEMVLFVQQKLQQDENSMKALFEENEIQTKRVAGAIKNNDQQELIDAIRKGQKTLEAMGVVSPKILPLVKAIEKEGGAVKILGGGGKKDGVGFLLGYHSDRKVLEKVCADYQYPVQDVALGEEGIRLEQKS
jgi:mevalonate kinase